MSAIGKIQEELATSFFKGRTEHPGTIILSVKMFDELKREMTDIIRYPITDLMKIEGMHVIALEGNEIIFLDKNDKLIKY